MGKRIRRNYDGSFKVKVVFEVLKEPKTLAQLSSEVVSALPGLFTAKKALISEDELTAPLYQQIGQLKVELDFLKKRLGKNP